MKTQQAALLIILLGTILNATANDCYSYGSMATLNIALQDVISFPRDVANGTVLLEATAPVKGFYYDCHATHTSGIQNNVGETTPGATTFPIRNTGLSWQVTYNNKPLPGYGVTGQAGYYSYPGELTFYLIKTGNISSNAEVPTGTYAIFRINNALSVLDIYVTSAPKVVTWSCETPDIKVHMGEHDLGIFEENGAYSPVTRFDIKLNNCPAGIKKVTYQLIPSPTSPLSNAATGTVELNKNSSEARGIALQILDDQQQPLALNQVHIFNDYSVTGGNFSIPLAARFIRTVPTGKYGAHDTGMKAGTANAEVLFVMSYM